MDINCGSIADGEQASQKIFDTVLVLASGKLTPVKFTASAKKRVPTLAAKRHSLTCGSAKENRSFSVPILELDPNVALNECFDQFSSIDTETCRYPCCSLMTIERYAG